jgi:ABC-type multidrug transport system ATPase subunit
MLAETGRAVVVTIHQPRSEIFHSFDKILLLCKGQVAFFGSPIKVWDFFTHALNYEDESLSDAGGSTNTADRILDLLKERNKQQQVLRKYRGCGEPVKVRCAVQRGKDNREPTPLPLDR